MKVYICRLAILGDFRGIGICRKKRKKKRKKEKKEKREIYWCEREKERKEKMRFLINIYGVFIARFVSPPDGIIILQTPKEFLNVR